MVKRIHSTKFRLSLKIGLTAMVIFVLVLLLLYSRPPHNVQPHSLSPKKHNSHPLIPQFHLGTVKKISISHRTQHITLSRQHNRWRIEGEKPLLVRRLAIEKMSRILQQATVSNCFLAHTDNLRQYGIGTDSVSLSIAFHDSKRAAISFTFGSRNPFDQRVYVQGWDTDEPLKVCCTEPIVKELAGTDILWWCDRRLIPFSTEEVTGVRLMVQGKLDWEVSKAQSQWKLTYPVQERAEYAATKAMLDELTSMKWAPLPEGSSSFKQEITSSPPYSVTVTVKSSHTKKTLEIPVFTVKEPNSRRNWFTVALSTAELVQLSSKMARITKIRFQDLRDPHIFHFNKRNITALTFTFPPEPAFTLSRQKATTPWSVEGEKNLSVNQDFVNLLLSQLLDITSIRSIPHPDQKLIQTRGLDKPWFSLVLKERNVSSPLEMRCGKRDIQKLTLWTLLLPANEAHEIPIHWYSMLPKQKNSIIFRVEKD